MTFRLWRCFFYKCLPPAPPIYRQQYEDFSVLCRINQNVILILVPIKSPSTDHDIDQTNLFHKIDMRFLHSDVGKHDVEYKTNSQIMDTILCRSVTKNLTAYRFNSAGWGLDDMKAEIHSFPTMYMLNCKINGTVHIFFS